MIGYQHVATNRACQVLWKDIQPGWYSDLAMLSQHAEYQHFAAFQRDLTICQVVWHISVDLEPWSRVPIERHGRPRPCEWTHDSGEDERQRTFRRQHGTRATLWKCSVIWGDFRRERYVLWWFQDESESIPLCSNLRFVSKKRILLTNFTQMFQCNRF